MHTLTAQDTLTMSKTGLPVLLKWTALSSSWLLQTVRCLKLANTFYSLARCKCLLSSCSSIKSICLMKAIKNF